MITLATPYPCEIEEVGDNVRVLFRYHEDGDPDSDISMSILEPAIEKWRALKPHLDGFLAKRKAAIKTSTSKIGTLRRIDPSSGKDLLQMLRFTEHLDDVADVEEVARNWFQRPNASRCDFPFIKLAFAQLRLNRNVWPARGIAHGTGVIFADESDVSLLEFTMRLTRAWEPVTVSHGKDKVSGQWRTARMGDSVTLGFVVDHPDGSASDGIALYLTSRPVSCADRIFIPRELQIAALRKLLERIDRKLGEADRPEFQELRKRIEAAVHLVFGKHIKLNQSRPAAKPRQHGSRRPAA